MQQLQLILIAAMLLAGSLRAQTPEPTEAVFARAVKAAEAGDWQTARMLFDHVIAKAPDMPGAYRNRALLHIQGQDWPAAERDLRQALIRQPDDADLRQLLAEILLQQGDSDSTRDALATTDALLQQQPGEPQLYRLRAQALMDLDQSADAQLAAEAMVRLAPADPVAWRLLARTSMAADDNRRAIDALEAAGRLSPPDADLIWTLCSLYIETDMLDTAARVALQANTQAPDDQRFKNAAQAIAGRSSRAVLPLLPALLERLPDDAGCALLAADAYRDVGQLTDARRLAARANALRPGHAPTIRVLGRVAMQLQEYDLALAQSRALQAYPSNRVIGLDLEVRVHMARRQWADAAEALHRLAAANPEIDYSTLRRQVEALRD